MRRALYVLGQLSDEHIEWLIAKGKRARAPAGHVLITEGAANEFVYIVLDGTLGIYVNANGREMKVAERGAGDILGEMSFIEDLPASATVKAERESILFTMPKTLLADHLAVDRDFAARFYRGIAISLSYRLREAMDQHAAGREDADGEELDPNVLDKVYLAGLRFDRIVRRMMAD
ncbi:MAG: cyclic nucleotide-binding domain-containing protein [Anaerolineae bacterium]|nr:cyclic nucleotide-binding domain-containing protein [Anaerolineae bacterium]